MSSTVATVWDPATTFKALTANGFKKAHLPLPTMIVSGMMAGVFVSYGANGMVYLLYGCPYGGPCKFLSGLCFSCALLFIVGLGAELFTGNCMLMMTVLSRQIYWHEFIKDIAIVWLANFVGIIITEGVLFGGGNNGTKDIISGPGKIACSVAEGKAMLEPAQIFFRGVSANLLVCIAVLLALASKSMVGKFFACAMPVMLFVVSGFEHCIANMTFFTMATFLGCNGGTLQGRYWLNLLISTLGNIGGGMALAVPYWYLVLRTSEDQLPEVPHNPADHRIVPRSVPRGEAPHTKA